MANDFNITDALWQKFISAMFSSGGISIPEDFHGRCAAISQMLDDDVTGIVNTLLEYSINSSSEAKFKIECSNQTLEDLLNLWLEKININIDGVPTGLQELAKEYYQEVKKGSSLCLLKIGDWKPTKIGNNEINVPTTLWFHNGASVYIKRPNEKNYKLGTEEYYNDSEFKNIIKKGNEDIIVQKAGTRWITKYPSPYCIRKGILKNYLAIEVLQSKGDEAVQKALPYILQLIKGTEGAFFKGLKYTDSDMLKISAAIKTAFKKYKNEKAEVPLSTTPFDEEFKHIIPDLLPLLREELFRQGYRALLAGLGFVDLLEIAQSRQETRLNPKPFIAEINSDVEGFKSILKEVIYLIIKENKEYHTKFFSENISLKIVSSSIKINTEQILSDIRSAYDRGNLSYESYISSLGFDYSTEKERRMKEVVDDEQEIFYPRIIVNQEEKAIDIVKKQPKTNKQENLEDENKNPNSPESKNFKKAEIIDDLEIAPYKNLDELPKYIKKMTKHCQEVFMATFNSVYEDTGDDGKAMAIAINAAKRCMNKQGYTYDKETKTWKKKE